MWVADNSNSLLNRIESINKRGTARNIATFDFSTLYTKLPLEDLIDKLKQVTDIAFKGGTNQYISIRKDSAGWTNNRKKETYSKEDVFNMIELVMNNTYFQFGDEIYKQTIGMPMGIDPAPPAANLYLHFYESKFMEKLTKTDYGKAKKYNNAERYIDDLNLINNDGELEVNIQNIYPEELILNKENKDDRHSTFLDLNLEIINKRVVTKTYDKRDAFSFDIINYPHMDSNIPKSQAYGVVVSETMRHFKNCTNLEDAALRIRTLQNKLLKKEYILQSLQRLIKKTLENNEWIRHKYHCNNEFIFKTLQNEI